MDVNETLLVVVDAQNGLITAETKQVVPLIVDLVSKWKQKGGAVLFTRMFNFPGSPLERLIDYTLLQGPPETDLIAEVEAFADTVIDKSIYSIFNETGTKFIIDSNYKTLAFCGFDTEACVLKSAFDAFDLGYVPLIVTDATASSLGEKKKAAGLVVAEAVLGERQLVDTDTFLTRYSA